MTNPTARILNKMMGKIHRDCKSKNMILRNEPVDRVPYPGPKPQP